MQSGVVKGFKVKDIVEAYSDDFNEALRGRILKLRPERSDAYVHFIGKDKRYDEYVPLDKLVNLNTSPPSSTMPKAVYSQSKELGESDDDDPLLAAEFQQFERRHKEITRIRNIQRITFDNQIIRTWYYSPYPVPFDSLEHLYICSHCFRYFDSQRKLQEHMDKFRESHPPGKEIYRDVNISVFEMQGWAQKPPCQSLCLLGKLFLDHKTLFYDVDGFVFYVLCEVDKQGCHFAGYFSREINPSEDNILACIVSLPPYQNKGYGKFLISLSYEIAKRNRKSGGPERPLSDLGRLAFHSYWRDTLLETIRDHMTEITSIDDLVSLTSIQSYDVVEALKEFNCVTQIKGEYIYSLNQEAFQAALNKNAAKKPMLKVKPNLLVWFKGDDTNV